MEPLEEGKKAKDVGLLVMFVFVLLGTLLMAWFADQPITPITKEASTATLGP